MSIYELNIKEFAKEVAGNTYGVEQEDTWNIYIEMGAATISYDEDFNDLELCSAKNKDTVIRIDADLIEDIDKGYENGKERYVIHFKDFMTNITLNKRD